jgi:lipopolysaccharide/colanic/teichoic acid biosynthesis glycosyltransferase
MVLSGVVFENTAARLSYRQFGKLFNAKKGYTHMTSGILKRLFDLTASVLGLALLLPVLVVIAIAVRLDSTGPVFYRGLRVGQFGRPFRIFKYRTMVMNAHKLGGPSSSADDPRITRMGGFLRRYKLDEFPQLLNVLKGEMSLVGPRPEVVEEVLLYNAEEKGLLEVRPGITDWASILFRNEGEILRGSADPHAAYREKIRPEKIRLGLEYVRRRSFATDFKIILKTLKAIVE